MSMRAALSWLVLAGLAMALPAAHAQAESRMMVAAVMARESFWVKKPVGSSIAAHGQATSKSSKAGVKTHGLGASENTATAASGAKKNNSIASELAGSKSVPWSIVVGLTLLTLLPALLLSMTPMVRLLVVFHFLRQALGTQTAPSNQILMGLALMMTWFLISPVLIAVDQQAVEPFRQGQISGIEAIERGVDPPKHFMLKYAREKDLALFSSASMIARPKTPDDLPLRVVVP